jgi:uncharacterized protein (UPF0335 family)
MINLQNYPIYSAWKSAKVQSILKYLNKLDSLYASNPDSLRANVEQQERLKQERLELIDQIKQVNSQIETGEKGRP